MNKIKICFHIGDISKCGGTENVTTQIANLLLKDYDNYEITILSSYYDKNLGPYFQGDKNIRYCSLFENPVKSYKVSFIPTILKLRKFIVHNDIDILIGVDTIMALFDLPASAFKKCKYIAWEHFNYNYNLGVKLRDLGRWLSVKFADKVVVLSKKDKKYFIANLGNNKNNIIQIYNPLTSQYKREKKYNEKGYILSIGRLTYQKGFDQLIDVAKCLKNKINDFKWLILGEGEDRNLLETLIKENNLENNVSLIGKVKNVKAYYEDASIYVMTSRFEGLGLVLLEASQYELPLISFDCDCGPSEIIIENKNGYLIDCFNVYDMSEKIYELLCDAKKSCEFSSNANLCITNFYPNKIIKKWDKLLKEVMK